MMFGLANPGDVLLAISFSGENKTVCELARMAKEKKNFVAGITNFPNSNLAKIADVILLTVSDEKQFRIGATTSRIAQYLIIDFLIIRLALNSKKPKVGLLFIGCQRFRKLGNGCQDGDHDYTDERYRHLVRISRDVRFAKSPYKYAGAPFAWYRIAPGLKTFAHFSEANGRFKHSGMFHFGMKYLHWNFCRKNCQSSFSRTFIPF